MQSIKRGSPGCRVLREGLLVGGTTSQQVWGYRKLSFNQIALQLFPRPLLLFVKIITGDNKCNYYNKNNDSSDATLRESCHLFYLATFKIIGKFEVFALQFVIISNITFMIRFIC